MTGEQPSTSQANGDEELKEEEEPLSAAQSGLHTFLERSRYIPLRLSADERRYLHLLEAALSVSSYTDKVIFKNAGSHVEGPFNNYPLSAQSCA